MNYPTKFAIGDRVNVSEGLYRGRKGRVIGYRPTTTRGLEDDFSTRGLLEPKSGLYSVKIGWFTSIRCFEFQLEFAQK